MQETLPSILILSIMCDPTQNLVTEHRNTPFGKKCDFFHGENHFKMHQLDPETCLVENSYFKCEPI